MGSSRFEFDICLADEKNGMDKFWILCVLGNLGNKNTLNWAALDFLGFDILLLFLPRLVGSDTKIWGNYRHCHLIIVDYRRFFFVYASANKQESMIYIYVRALKLDKFASLKILQLSLTKIDEFDKFASLKKLDKCASFSHLQ